MKRVSAIIFMMLVSLAVAVAQPPQGQRGGQGGHGGQGGQRGDMYKMLCQKIVEMLRLEESKQEEFTTIYMAYSQATKGLRERGRGARPLNIHNSETPRMEERAAPKPQTAEEVEAQILRSFESSIKAIEIKRDYYTKFRTILTPQEISKMYELERHIRDRALEEQRRRMTHGGGNRAPQNRE